MSVASTAFPGPSTQQALPKWSLRAAVAAAEHDGHLEDHYGDDGLMQEGKAQRSLRRIFPG